MKLLTIDIGNTNTVFGITDRDKTHVTWRISSDHDRTDDEYTIFLDYHFKKNNINISEITDTVICSVVPAVVPGIASSVKTLTGKSPLIIGQDMMPRMDVKLYNPRELGMDRLVNGYAGYKLFRCPLIIIDFGTATTFDLISGDGAYMGGIIIPGIKISLEALNLKTAQLPKIYPDKPSALIGRSTIESIRSGGYYGYICMINGLIDMLKQDLSEKYHFAPDAVKVIATGGFSHKLHKEIKKFDEILYDLTLFGIFFVYSDYKLL